MPNAGQKQKEPSERDDAERVGINEVVVEKREEIRQTVSEVKDENGIVRVEVREKLTQLRIGVVADAEQRIRLLVDSSEIRRIVTGVV